MTKLIVDGDEILYRAAWSADRIVNGKLFPGSLVPKLGSAKQMCIQLLQRFPNCGSMTLAFSGRKNFRKQVPSYKANRKNMVQPTGLYEIREYLSGSYDTLYFDWLEADDILGTYMSQMGAIGVSSDKDLMTCPGLLYNRRTKKLYDISVEEANKNFWIQTLTGDVADNIKGIPWYGQIRSQKVLNGLSGHDLYARVAFLYHNHYGCPVKAAFELNTNAHLLYIKRNWNDQWKSII